MFIPYASHTILRPAIPALRSSSTRISLRYVLHNSSFLLRSSRASPVHKFHATSFPSATHRTNTRDSRDWRPPGRFRRFIRRLNFIPQSFIIFGILGINGVVFAAWSYVQMFHVRLPFVPTTRSQTHSVQGVASRNGIPPPDVKWLVRWLQNNFLNTYENLRRGRLYVQSSHATVQYSRHSSLRVFIIIFPSWTLVTSTFSHADPGHAFVNGLTFWFLAPTALAVLGNAQFLVLYLGSAFNSPSRNPRGTN